MITHEVLDGIGDAIYALDADWRISFINREAERFFARDRRGLVGRNLWECFPAAVGTPLGASLESVMESRQPAHIDVLSPTTGRWTDTRIFPLANGGLVASWRDITAAKRQQEDLARAVASQQKVSRELRTLVDNVPAMIAYWDEDLRCRSANDKYLEWFGRTPEEMDGIRIQDLLGEPLFRSNEPFIRGALGGQPQGFERTLRKPSGHVAHTWAQYLPDIDAEGHVHGFYALVTDVSPLKEAEQRLMAANACLEVARKEAEEATAVKSAFLSNMSHELRNPLTSIIGYAELLTHTGQLSEKQRKYLLRILDAGTALRATVNDILDFSKLEAGQVEIEPRPVDPAALAGEVLEMYELDFARKGLAQSFEAGDAPARVFVDPTRMRQILTNLIGNAVKFTASGRIVVRCLYDRPGGLLRYEVIDTGPGIPPAAIGKLFQRFSQVDASTTRVFGGTGLGLAICKGLAEAMGGSVGATSKVGEGSCFWAQVPAPTAGAESRGREEGAQTTASPDRLRGLRLLVADDDAYNRDLVRQIVEPLGVAVTEAAGGSEAVAAARADEFDLILMDIRMPEIDGPTAAQLIRALPDSSCATPIVAFSADVVGDTPPDWAALFDSVLAKPLVSTDLIALLEGRPPHGMGGSASETANLPARESL